MRIFLGTLMCLGLWGCQPGSSSENAKAHADISDIRNVAEQLRDQNLKLAEEVKKIRQRIARLELQGKEYSSATFDPSDDELFQRIDTNLGPIVVILENVESLADGSKVTLRIGNLSAASFSRTKLQLEWGAREPVLSDKATEAETQQYFKAFEEWTASQQKKEVEVIEPLFSGSWNPTKINLPKIPPSKLGYVRVSASVNQVALTPRK